MRSPLQPAERLEITDVHSLAAIVARDPQFPERRRRLIRVVAATVGGCTLILIAAGVARLLHPPPSQAPAPITIAETPPPSTAASARTPVADPAPTPPPAPTTGIVHLQKPAVPGHVWIDGKKAGQAELTIACGKHQIKVGRGRAHTVDLPCGGELNLSK